MNIAKMRAQWLRIKSMVTFNLGMTEIPLSRIANIELTNRCNQMCIFCPMNRKDVIKPVMRKKQDMSIEEFERLIAKYKKHFGVLSPCLHGESLIHPDFKKAIEIMQKYGVQYSLNTNGSILEKHMDVIEKYPPKLILISLYTTDPKKFRKLTGNGDVEKVLRATRMMINLKKQGKIDTVIALNAIRMHGFENEVEKLKEYFKGEDVQVEDSILHSWSGRVDVSKLGDRPEASAPFKYCLWPWRSCIIGSDMGVYVCCHHEDTPMGYITNGTSLEDIWNSKKYQDFRKNILTGNIKKNDICINCDQFCPDTVTDKPSLLFFTKPLFILKLKYLLKMITIRELINEMVKYCKEVYGK